tara:strand:+ start:663 stop:1214 length:552 start_codon:yes stop_codon:yes gene_type:complete
MNDVIDLGLMSEGSSEYIRFKPSVNAWIADGDEVQLEDVLLDPSTLKVGWGKITKGEAPEWSWDERLGKKGTRPTPEHKRGFSVMVKIKDKGWREWSANGVGVMKGFSELWSVVGVQLKDNTGKAVHLKYKGARIEEIGQNNTRIPEFEVKAWREMTDKPPVKEEPVKEEPQAHPDLDDDIPF